MKILNCQIQNRVIAFSFIMTHEYMHQCVNEYICKFSNFGPIIIKFSPNCRAKEFGMLFTILGSFCSFLDWKGADIRRKIGLGKSLFHSSY